MPIDAIESATTIWDVLFNFHRRLLRVVILLVLISIYAWFKLKSTNPFVGFDGLGAVLGLWLVAEIGFGISAYNNGERGAEFWLDA